jgi:adenylosuccinate lyase
VKELDQYLSVEGYVKYQAIVERALAETLAKYGVCSASVAAEIAEASKNVTASEVASEERRVRHDIRALVNVIQRKISDEAKPYVHLSATSYDIVDTANALRYREAIESIIIPDMIKLEKTWIELARKWRDEIQIGRTHGQFAEPITFGFTIAQYVNRWGNRILQLKESTRRLVGKFSGAVGAYNALSLLVPDPEAFERDLLSSLGLEPALISTQIVPSESFTDLIHSIVSAWGVIANFARDMRHLQRSEIGEVAEPFEEEQVGSSTMPQKRNPISFENVESLWKEFVPRMITKYLDQVSEHQRDLTNSASQRYDAEFLMAFDFCVRRINKVSQRLLVDKANLTRNLKLALPYVVAEPIYVLLASAGHPEAHEYVRRLSMESFKTGRSLVELAFSDSSLQPYLMRLSSRQMNVIRDPSRYIGIASAKVDRVLTYWEEKLREEKLW